MCQNNINNVLFGQKDGIISGRRYGGVNAHKQRGQIARFAVLQTIQSEFIGDFTD